MSVWRRLRVRISVGWDESCRGVLMAGLIDIQIDRSGLMECSC